MRYLSSLVISLYLVLSNTKSYKTIRKSYFSFLEFT